MAIDKEYIAATLSETPKEMRAEAVEKLAEFYGVSKQTVWRKANEAGFRVRSQRTDKGVTAIDEHTVDIIAARVHISKRLNKKHTNSVKKAVEDLNKKTKLPVGYQRICSILREKGLDKESLLRADPHVKMISLHPNHVHQFDVTNCLQWHFKNKGGMKEDSLQWLYTNKVVKEAKKIKYELLRFVIVDHCSGAFYFKYYYTTGERAEDGADFFYNAWADKAPLIEKKLGIADYNGDYRFQGVPKMLVSDKGSILANKVIKNLMAGLGVEISTHQAGNPRAKGMVEGLMKIIGEGFESDLKIYNIQNLDDLNRFALDWCINFNALMGYRRTNMSRSRFWLQIKPNELQICPDETIFKKLQHKPEEKRKCDGNGVISYENKYYKCPDVNAAYKWVIIKINAYEYPKADIHFNGFVHHVSPLKTDQYGRIQTPDAVIYGEYRTPKQTDIQKAKIRLEQVAHEEWGIQYKGKKDKRQAMPPITSALPEQMTHPDNIVFIKPQGTLIQTPDIHTPLTEETVIPIDRPFNPTTKMRLIPVQELIRRYTHEIGRLTIEENKRLKTTFKDGVPENITATDIYNFLHSNEKIIKNKFA